MTTLKLQTGAPNEIVLERVFEAPRQRVVKAMTTPDLITRWLGGVRAEVVGVEVDARVGGRYRYVFRRPDGKQFALGGVFHELTEERAVQTEAMEGQPGEATATTTWTESAGTTTLHLVIAFETQAVRDAMVTMGMPKGIGESYDKLAELLAGP